MRAALIALGLVALASPASAACGPMPEVFASLASPKYAEREVYSGFSGQPGAVVVVSVWANEETGTWTILSITAEGVACMIAAGDGWVATTAGEPL